MLNKVSLIGRLGKDPEVRHLDNDRTVANFNLATSEKYKNKAGEQVEDTQWHNLVIWGGQAKVAEKYLRKGSLIHAEGKIKTRSYEDKEGQKRYVTEILVDSFLMLSKNDSAEQAANRVAEAHDADLPFG